MPPKKRQKIGTCRKAFKQGNDNEVCRPRDTKVYYTCPFPKHNHVRYESVNNACTHRSGFQTIGQLNEHIWRVHSLQRGCVKCKKRFTKCKIDEIEQYKRQHDERGCSLSPRTLEDPEWLTEEQEARLTNLKVNPQDSNAESWKRIYKCIFPNDSQSPHPFYDYLIPRHLALQPGPSDTTHVPLQAAALAQNDQSLDVGFEFSILRGPDSGYQSGTITQQAQNADGRLRNTPPWPQTQNLDIEDHGANSLVGMDQFGPGTNGPGMFDGVDYGSEDSISRDLNEES